MRSLIPSTDEALALIEKVDPKFRPVWEGRPQNEQVALARYFLPHHSTKAVIEPSRPRVAKWYCPFASQDEFPTGHRYCINVFTGCAHRCLYCYASAYGPDTPHSKDGFQELLVKDMQDLELFDVPPAPVHLSNSTDPFQPLEETTGDTRYALEQILAHRHRFTTVVILSKNPLLAVRLGYVDLFKKLDVLPTSHPKRGEFGRQQLPGFIMEVSLAFWRELARQAYDPGTPPVESRIEGLRALHEQGIPLVLRIDPLFPRSPLPTNPSRRLGDFGLPEAQTLEDLDTLVRLAREVEARHAIYSPAKIVQPRGRKLSETMQAMRRMYEAVASPHKLDFHGGSWRLPWPVTKAHVVQPFLDICQCLGVRTKYCKQNLTETP